MTVGPWIQGDDYEAVGTGLGITDSNEYQVAEQTDAGVPFAPPGDAGIFAATEEQAVTSPTWTDGPPPFGGITSASLSGVIQRGFQGYFNLTGDEFSGDTLYAAFYLHDSFGYTSRHVNTPPAPDDWPDGAIGYEYENPLSEAVGATLRGFEFLRLNWDSTVGAPIVGGDWQTRLAGYRDIPTSGDIATVDYQALDGLEAGTIFTADRGTGTPGSEFDTSAVAGDLDVSSYLYGDPTDGYLVFTTLIDMLDAPVPANMLHDNEGVAFGAIIYGNIHLIYTLRPPRHRFLFAGMPSRRKWPREDGLAGSVRRHWPPPNTRQGSGRRIGSTI